MNVITCHRRNRWWNFDLVAVKTLIILQLLNFSSDHGKKTNKNNHIKASSLNTSSARLWDKHGTTYLVYFTLIKCKKTWIGRECGFTNSGTIWATVDGERDPWRVSCRCIRMRYRSRRADLHTQAHSAFCVFMHTQKNNNKNPACMHANTHLRMCIQGHT